MSKSDKYSLAPAVEELARDIIQSHHHHLIDARIEYLFRSGKWENKGKVVLGQAKMVAEDVRFISEFDFIIIINLDAWNNAESDIRRALVDHELHHCEIDYDDNGDPKLSILNHDVQEFISIVSRYGLWQEDLRLLVAASQNKSEDGKVVS